MLQLIIRASRSHIPGMLSPLSSRLVRLIAFVLAVLSSVPAPCQKWASPEEQLAEKIVSVTGPKTLVLEVINRSSLPAARTDEIRRNLLTQLAVLGARFVPAEQAVAEVRVSLSEDLQSYVWIAEIRQAGNVSSLVMVSLPRTVPLAVEPQPAAMVLHKAALWSQPEQILDVAVVLDSNPVRMLVLDAMRVTSYRLQDNRWQTEQAQPVEHTRPWPRDLHGRLVLSNSKDHLFDVYLPGVHCRSSAGPPPAMTCQDSDDPWPAGPDLFRLNASFTPSRNYFSGAIAPAVGKLTTTPAFYSAAAFPRDSNPWWLLATVNGQVHLLDGVTDQVVDKLAWGSDVASIRSGCGSGWQVLATGGGPGRTDSIRAFETAGRDPVAASAPLEVRGIVTALWTESRSGGAVAVVHNLETGRYEAFRLTLTCDR